ncbi:small fragment nuclease [Maylandia zebra]|uniref:Oligoribonuclease, mitochondrial n=2 Tax=Haplochromini TaxID=319058 RepID=A0A3P9D996_9CICH|nr:oligoribonuclease, mitochondrial [Maylandia zebra]XP_024657229.1 oligoribonuclease, mitochondrial-like [Maylandia zebra]XP_026038773.1 oligoribonuclease, mitochondrial [Astatotilapia calliptera]
MANKTGNGLSMPVCSRSSAWVLATFSKSLFALSLGKAALSRPGSPLLAPAAGQASTRGSMTATGMSQRMVWVDLEMTGLDVEKDQIIEMACLITDSNLNILAEGPNVIIKQPDELLEGMSEWCKEHHGKSGLTQAVRDSKITLEQAEYEFLSFVRQHTPPGQCPLAGNSVHADKRFLDKYMPQFMYHLHYRIIDVSTIKELSRRWFPEEYKMVPHKKATHRALEDIRESIKELQYYRANIFKASEKNCTIVENGGSSMS